MACPVAISIEQGTTPWLCWQYIRLENDLLGSVHKRSKQGDHFAVTFFGKGNSRAAQELEFSSLLVEYSILKHIQFLFGVLDRVAVFDVLVFSLHGVIIRHMCNIGQHFERCCDLGRDGCHFYLFCRKCKIRIRLAYLQLKCLVIYFSFVNRGLYAKRLGYTF
ncbi:hypothetical protein D1872_242140 [compost metagenome]